MFSRRSHLPPDDNRALRPWRWWSVATAFACCAVSQWSIRHGLYWGPASAILVIGAAAIALLLGPPPNEQRVWPPLSPPRRRMTRRVIGVVIAASGFAVFAVGTYWLVNDWLRNFDRSVPTVVAGLVVWSLGLALLTGPAGHATRTRPSRRELALVGAVVVLGLFLRFYRFDVFPPPDGVCAVEEPQAGETTHTIIHSGLRPWEFVGDRWLPVPTFLLMGESLTALRLPFAFVSALTVPALYLLLRQLVGWPAALFATALSAISSWNLFYARLGHNIFATTLVVVVLWALCMRAHRRGGLALYPWIGFLSGYTLYTYAGYRGTTAFVALFLVLSLLGHIRSWRNLMVPRLRALARWVVVQQAVGLVLAAAAFASPLVVLERRVRNNPAFFFEAAQRSVVHTSYLSSDWEQAFSRLFDRIHDTAMLFNHLGDGSETFNYPSAPMLDPLSGILFLIGVVYCLRWPLRRWQGYFAFCFFVLLTGGIVVVGNFDPRRLQGIVPLIFVLVAFPADEFGRLSVHAFRRWGRSLAVGVAALAFAVGLYFNIDLYFVRAMQSPRVIAAFHNRYTLGLQYLRSLPSRTYLLLVGDTLNFFMPSDFTWLRPKRIPGSATLDLLPLFAGRPGAWTGRDLRVLLEQPLEMDALAPLLRERFPGTQCETIKQFGASHLDYMVCAVRQDSATTGFVGGVQARYYRPDAQEPFLERTEPVISYGLTPLQCLEPAVFDKGLCRTVWEGVWEAPEAGPYRFRAEGRSSTVTLSIDDKPIRNAVTLDAGPHRIRVESRSESVQEAGTRLLWRRDEQQPWQLVTFAQFDRASVLAPATNPQPQVPGP